VRRSYAFTEVTQEEVEPVVESVPNYRVYEPQITIDNPTDAKPIQANNNWQFFASIAFGALSVALAGIGIAKAARQARTRRLVRKFA
jgi:hypothetical protein